MASRTKNANAIILALFRSTRFFVRPEIFKFISFKMFRLLEANPDRSP
jgi:hypothetical protein